MRGNFFGVHRDLILAWRRKPEWIIAWNLMLCFTPYEDNPEKNEVRGLIKLTAIRNQVDMTDKAWRLFVDHLKENGMLHTFNLERHGRGSGSTLTAFLHDDYLPVLPDNLQQDISEKQGQSKGVSKGQSKGDTKDVLNSVQDGESSDLGQSKGRSKGGLKDGLKDGHIKEYNSLSVSTTNTPPTECKKENKQNSFFEIPDSLKYIQGFIETWEAWLEERKTKRKPVTAIAAKKQLEFLARQPDPVACIEESLRQGWQGIFELKNKPAKKPRVDMDIDNTDWDEIARKYAPDGSLWEEYDALHGPDLHNLTLRSGSHAKN